MAEVVLLVGQEDQDIWDFFLRSSLPLAEHSNLLVDALTTRGDWASPADLEPLLNVGRSRLQGLLKILEVEGAVERDGGKYRRTLAPWSYDHDRIQHVREARLAEQQAMQDYASTESCRMQFLLEHLDDPDTSPCGRCDSCVGAAFDSFVDPAAVERAAAFLRGRPVRIEPRSMWPGHPIRGRIPPDERAEPGRALCMLGDGGWGRVVLECKHAKAAFPDDLVTAAAELVTGWLREADEQPVAVVYVPPSSPDRAWTEGLANGLARRLGLPVVSCIRRVRPTRPQKDMNNSSQQLGNIFGAFEIGESVPAGPVMLVDDVCDSRWTLTYLAHLLRLAGSGPVLPFVLAAQKGGA
jgi:ATP-dependent DNA helicase RecQ